MTKRSYPVLALALVLVSALPRSSRADGRFDRASAAYAEERFDDAARELEGLLVERGYSPEVLVDLGDVHRRRGELGLAVLAYERARLLAPGDPAVAEGLHAARAEGHLARPSESAAEELAALWPARRWLFAGAIALALFCAAALFAGAVRRARWVGVLVALSSTAVVAACAAALYVGTLGVARAVVIADEAIGRVAPFAGADPLFTMRAGELVRIEDQHGEHVRVAAPDGERGWVARDALEPVVPAGIRAGSSN